VVEEGDLAGQAGFVYGQLDGLLRTAGGDGLGDLVKTVEFVAPAAAGSYREVAGVRERLLGRPFPASTGVVCAALLQPDWLIEVDATAVVSSPGGGQGG
jgi:enamine deaminase RidA (YjgF/YER057c/UK114 family)